MNSLILAAVVSYATYFGGSSNTQISATAADAQNNIYIAGWTQAADLPVTPGAYQTQAPACVPGESCARAFVARISGSGKLLWSTYLAGGALTTPSAIAVDAGGNVYVAGRTDSAVGFVVKLDAAGSRLLYSTQIAGGAIAALALGPQGTLVAVGSTAATNLPTTNALQPQFPGGKCGNKYGSATCTHAFFIGWRSSDMQLQFASYLGGTGMDYGRGAAIDAAGNIYLTGGTNSPDFPLSNALQQAVGAGKCFDGFLGHYPSVCPDAFLTKIGPDGRTLLYSTRLGGAMGDSGNAIAVDPAGDVIVAGTTASADFPLVHAAESYPGPATCFSEADVEVVPCPHAFAARVKADGSALMYSTYISGKLGDAVSGAVLDASGNLYVSGYTMSTGGPVSEGALRHCSPSYLRDGGSVLGNDGTDGLETSATTGFLVELDANGALVFSTYFGGSGGEQGNGLALDGNGGVWLAGATMSPDLPVTSDAIQPKSPDNSLAGFLARLTFSTEPPSPPQIDTGCVVNSASLQSKPVAPGELVTVFGSGLGPESGAGAALDAQGRVVTELAGTTVTFDGIPAPLLYVAVNQINAIVPFEVAGKSSTQIVATVNGAVSAARQLTVTDVAPGVFTTDLTGTGQIVVLNQDGTLNSAGHPAARGSVLTFWVTGMGLLSQSYPDGEVVQDGLGTVASQFAVNLVTPGQFPLEILYAGQAPAMAAGVVQVNGRIPAGVQPWLSQVELFLRVASVNAAGGVFANTGTIWLEYLGSSL